MPTEDLAFKYPFDGPYNSFDSRKRMEALVKRGSYEQQQQQQQQQEPQQQQQPEPAIDDDLTASAAAKSVLRRVSGLGDVMVNILARHIRHHTELSPSSPSSAASAAAINNDKDNTDDHDSKVLYHITSNSRCPYTLYPLPSDCLTVSKCLL